VHLAADGTLIVIHDETIDRITNGSGLVSKFTTRELKSFQVANQFEIPTLNEVFDVVNKNAFINIELKGNHTAEAVVQLITYYIAEKNWKFDAFIVSSFDWIALQKVSQRNPKINIGVLTQTNLDFAVAFATFINAKSIHPYFHLVSAENTKQMQEKGFQVFPWTVNEIEDIQKMKSFEVDGIISDFPDRL